MREVVRRYRDAGYDVLAITDHLSTELSGCARTVTDASAHGGSGLTLLSAAELEVAGADPGGTWDLLAIGLPLDFPAPEPAEPFPAAAQRAADAGAFVAVPHPWWTNLNTDDIPEAAHGIEVYNEACGWLSDRAGSWQLYDQALGAGRRLAAIANDDAHFDGAPYHRTWTMIRADDSDPPTVLQALKRGACYCSQGPVLHDVRMEDGQLTVACEEAAAVFVTGPGWPFRVARDVAGEVRFDLRPGNDWEELHPQTTDGFFAQAWLRVTVIDHDDRRAWTGAISRSAA